MRAGMDDCRERGQASDFNAALDDHLQYLRRQKDAARMKAEYDAGALASTTEAGSSSGGPSQDLALKPGETIKVALPGSRVRQPQRATEYTTCLCQNIDTTRMAWKGFTSGMSYMHIMMQHARQSHVSMRSR
jgi:Protein of unknown function (DUF1681)